MAADTSLILAAGDLPGRYQDRLAQLRSGQLEENLYALKLGEAMEERELQAQERERQARLRELLPQVFDQGGDADYAGLARAQMLSGDIEGGLKTAGSAASIEASRARQRLSETRLTTEQLIQGKAKLEATLRHFGATDDEESYQEALARAHADPNLTPQDLQILDPHYDKNKFNKLRRAALSAKDRIGIELREQELARQGAQFQQAQAATESRFLRKPAAQGFQMSYDAEGRPVVSYGQGPKLTEGQGKATALALRGREAVDQLSTLEASGYRPNLRTGAKQWAGRQLGAKNMFLDASGQQYEQALLNFGTAIGRFESGAAIPEQEWERFVEQYGAQPWEGDDVIAQKQQNRATAIRGIGIAAGPGLQPALEPAPVSPYGAGTGSITNRTREMQQPAMSPETEARRQRAVEALRRRGVAGY